MRRDLKFSKKGIIALVLMLVLIAIIAGFAMVKSMPWLRDANLSVEQKNQLNEEHVIQNVSGENTNMTENYLSGEIIISGENVQEISIEKYEINEENNTISFSDEVGKGMFCVSISPNGPSDEDEWIDIDGQGVYDIEEIDEQVEKVYVYYKAGTTSRT